MNKVGLLFTCFAFSLGNITLVLGETPSVLIGVPLSLDSSGDSARQLLSSRLEQEINKAVGLPTALRAKLLLDLARARFDSAEDARRVRRANAAPEPATEQQTAGLPAPLNPSVIADLKASLDNSVLMVRQVEPIYPLTVAVPSPGGMVYADDYPTPVLTGVHLYLDAFNLLWSVDRKSALTLLDEMLALPRWQASRCDARAVPTDRMLFGALTGLAESLSDKGESVYVGFMATAMKNIRSIDALPVMANSIKIYFRSRKATEVLVAAYIGMLDRIDSDSRSYDRAMPDVLFSFQSIYDFYKNDKALSVQLSKAFQRFIDRRLSLTQCDNFRDSDEKIPEYSLYRESMAQVGLPNSSDPRTVLSPRQRTPAPENEAASPDAQFVSSIVDKIPGNWDGWRNSDARVADDDPDSPTGRAAAELIAGPRPPELIAREKAFMDLAAQARFRPNVSGEALYQIMLGLKIVWENEGRPVEPEARSFRLIREFMSMGNAWGQNYVWWYDAADKLFLLVKQAPPDDQKKILLAFMESRSDALSFIARVNALQSGFVFKQQ